MDSVKAGLQDAEQKAGQLFRAVEDSGLISPGKSEKEMLIVQQDDILFLDFGPIFEDWEADFGRTYVLGHDPVKHKLQKDIETAWYEGKAWFDSRSPLTGKEFYAYVSGLAGSYGWIPATMTSMFARIITTTCLRPIPTG